jgi:porin
VLAAVVVLGATTLPAAARQAAPDPAAPDAAAAPPLERSIEDRLTIGGIMAGTYQFQSASGENVDGGVVTVRPTIEFELSDRDLLHLTFGLAGGNAINDVSSFALSPLAKDVEQDLRDVNGSGRDYIQTAWYQHTTEFGGGSLAIVGGIIDSTEYLDQNAFANDQYTQFMNEAFVNAPVGFYQSYSPGVALAWTDETWSVNASFMRVEENDAGRDFLHAGLQVGYRTENALGEGNYRVTLTWADREFLDPTGTTNEGRLGIVASVDQMVSETAGVWARLGTQDDAAAVTHEWMITGGLDLRGDSWGRPQDNAGLGLGWLDGGNTGVESTFVAEAYVRFALTDAIAFSLDAQYMDDRVAMGPGLDGAILGARLTYEF